MRSWSVTTETVPMYGSDSCPAASLASRRAVAAPALSCGLQQVPDSHQVVGGCRQSERPANARQPFVPRFPHQANRFHPAEDLLDALASALTDRIARVSRRPPVDRAR